MPRRGLNREIVVDTAVELIERAGYENFSMRELAGELRVKPASLYNHIESMKKLRLEVGRRVVAALVQAEEAAVQGKDRDEALLALGPDRLPGYAKKLGQAVSQFKKYSEEATREIKESVVEPLEEAQAPLREAVKPLEDLDRSVREDVKDLKRSFSDTGRERKTAPPETAKPDGEAPEDGTGGGLTGEAVR